jgi:hypothetical protein
MIMQSNFRSSFLRPVGYRLALLLLMSASRASAAPGLAETLDQLLDRTAGVVQGSLQQLSDVACTEVVSQDKLEKNNKVEYKEKSTFDYVLLVQSNAGEPTLVESRLPKEQAQHKRNLPLLVTNGFATLVLVFHPYYRGGFEFTVLGDEVANDRTYVKVSFRHIKGLRTTTALLVRGREYALDLEGVAWIDKDTGTVLRINARLKEPMDDIGLRAMQADVLYAPVTFQGAPQAYWLPSQAVIDVQSAHQHWRNLHRFTAYRQFSTEVKSTIGQTP